MREIISICRRIFLLLYLLIPSSSFALGPTLVFDNNQNAASHQTGWKTEFNSKLYSKANDAMHKKVHLMLGAGEHNIRHKLRLVSPSDFFYNISKAYKIMELSRDPFYLYKAAVEDGNFQSHIGKNRRKTSIKNPVHEITEKVVIAYAIEQPAHGPIRASNELQKRGVFISPSDIHCVWLRHQLARFKDRLRALKEKMAREKIILTKEQVELLKKKKNDDLVSREIEMAHPGYLGFQDTFYVGNLKGVGRIYQQTFIDTYSNIVIAKLYTINTPITSADLLDDRVLPFFENHQLPLLRIVTDTDTEYFGKPESHDYQLYLASNDIDHIKSKTRSFQANGICQRFHKTVLHEFYQVTLKKKIYPTIKELQKDLDEWMFVYNNERTSNGKMCCGRTPLETLEDGKALWQDMNLH